MALKAKSPAAYKETLIIDQPSSRRYNQNVRHEGDEAEEGSSAIFDFGGRNFIKVKFNGETNTLEISGSSPIMIMPQVSNVVAVRLKREFDDTKSEMTPKSERSRNG